MKPLIIIAGVLCGLGVPVLLFGLTILAFSLVDVAGQVSGIGTE